MIFFAWRNASRDYFSCQNNLSKVFLGAAVNQTYLPYILFSQQVNLDNPGEGETQWILLLFTSPKLRYYDIGLATELI